MLMLYTGGCHIDTKEEALFPQRTSPFLAGYGFSVFQNMADELFRRCMEPLGQLFIPVIYLIGILLFRLSLLFFRVEDELGNPKGLESQLLHEPLRSGVVYCHSAGILM